MTGPPEPSGSGSAGHGVAGGFRSGRTPLARTPTFSLRALLLLLVVVLAFLAVRWFRPGPAVAAEEGVIPAEAGVRFLPPSTAPRQTPEPLPAAPDEAVSQEPTEEAKSWPASLVPASDGEEEVRVATALVHGTPAEVQAAAASFPRNRALLLESFSWAAVGERKLALSLSEKIDREALDGRERALFEAALTGRAPTPADAPSGTVSLAMEMTLRSREAKLALSARKFPEAAAAYSGLLVSELVAPWPPDRPHLAEWTQGLDEAQREHRWNPRGTWPAVEMKVASGDSLIGIRLRYLSEHPGARMCTGLIERANRVKGFLQPNQVLRVPTEPVRVLVDLDARWALFLIGNEVAAAWPVGIGRPGEETPVGTYSVRNKLENPPWMKEGQEPIPFGDPRNPLVQRWRQDLLRVPWDLGPGERGAGLLGWLRALPQRGRGGAVPDPSGRCPDPDPGMRPWTGGPEPPKSMQEWCFRRGDGKAVAGLDRNPGSHIILAPHRSASGRPVRTQFSRATCLPWMARCAWLFDNQGDP